MGTNSRPKIEFTPPTTEQVRSLFQNNPPARDSMWLVRLPIFVGIGAIAILLLVDSAILTLLLWTAFIAVFVTAMLRVRYMRRLESQGLRIDELAMQRRYVEALRASWMLLPKARKRHALYMRLTNAIAHSLNELKCYEASAEAYDFIINQLPLEATGVKQLRIQRAIAWLMEDRLADADDTLRHLRGIKDDHKGTILCGAYTYAELLQCIKTYHFEEGIAMSNSLIEDIRPIGIDAGYGYAMMATCYDEMAKRTDNDTDKKELHQKALEWWANATTLINEEHLLNRLPKEIKPIRYEPS